MVLWLRAAQRLLYQEAVSPTDEERCGALEALMNAETMLRRKTAGSDESRSQSSAACHALEAELLRAIGCLTYEGGAAVSARFDALLEALAPTLTVPAPLSDAELRTTRREAWLGELLLAGHAADAAANASAAAPLDASSSARLIRLFGGNVLAAAALREAAQQRRAVLPAGAADGAARAAAADVASEEAAAGLALTANLRGLGAALSEGGDGGGAAHAAVSQQLDNGRVVARLAEGLTAIALQAPGLAGAPPTGGDDGGWSSDGSDRGGGRAGRRVGGSGGGAVDASWEKVLLNALRALHGLARMDPRALHAHWGQLLPAERGGAPQRQRSLVAVLATEPSPKVRAAGAAALQALVQRSRAYMAAAEERRGVVGSRAASFTSLSQALATMLAATHRGLCEAAAQETHPLAAQQTIKALLALVSHAPYARLRRGLLPAAVAAMRAVLARGGGDGGPQRAERDASVRTAALGCLAAVLENPQTLAEMQGAPGAGDPAWSAAGAGVASADVLLADLMKVAAGEWGDPHPVRVEALRGISAVARRAGDDLLSAHWGGEAGLGAVLRRLLRAPTPPPLRTHAARVVEAVVGVTDEEKGERDDDADALGAIAPPSPQKRPADPAAAAQPRGAGAEGAGAAAMWAEVMDSLLPTMFADGAAPVRASAVAAVALLPAAGAHREAFGRCLEHVWAAARPGDAQESAVRASGVKTLGLLAHLPTFEADVPFLIRASDALDRCSRDAFVAVRIKAAFALANICQRCHVLRERASSEYLRHHAGLMLLRLADFALRAMSDNDKVRVYGVRSLGYLGSCPDFTAMVAASTSPANALQVCARIEQELARIIASDDHSVKASPVPRPAPPRKAARAQRSQRSRAPRGAQVRWNACHAARLLLSPPPPPPPAAPPLGPALVAALLRAMAAAANFKVRIQATRALCGIGGGGGDAGGGEVAAGAGSERLAGGWAALVGAWQEALAAAAGELVLSDPSQYKYKAASRQPPPSPPWRGVARRGEAGAEGRERRGQDTLRREQQRCVLALTAMLRELPPGEAVAAGLRGEDVAGAEACALGAAHAGDEPRHCAAAAAALISLRSGTRSGREDGAVAAAGDEGSNSGVAALEALVAAASFGSVADRDVPPPVDPFRGRSLAHG